MICWVDAMQLLRCSGCFCVFLACACDEWLSGQCYVVSMRLPRYYDYFGSCWFVAIWLQYGSEYLEFC